MKNLKLVSLMALTALFLFLGGCQKDDDISPSVTQTILNFKNFKYLPPELSHLQTTDNRDDKLVEVNSVFNAVLDTFQKYDPGNLKTEKFINDYGLPLWSQYKVIVADNDEITYSIPIYNSFKKKIDGQFCITKSNQKIFIKFVDKTALLSEYSNNNLRITKNEALFHLNRFYFFEQELLLSENEILFNIITETRTNTDDSPSYNNSGYYVQVCWIQISSNGEPQKIPFPLSGQGWIDIWGGVAGAANIDEAIDNIKNKLIPGLVKSNSDDTYLTQAKNYLVELEKFKRNQPLISANTSIWTRVCKFVWITYGSDPFDYIINANGGSTSGGNVWIDTYEENRHFYDRCSLIDPSTSDPNDIGAYSTAVWSASDLEKCSNLQSLIQNCPNMSKSLLISFMTLLDMNSITKNEFKKFSVMCGKPGALEALNSFLICNNQTLNSPRSFNNYIANYTEIFEWMSSHNNDPIANQFAQDMFATLCRPSDDYGNGVKVENLNAAYDIVKSLGGIQLSSSEFLYIVKNATIIPKLDNFLDNHPNDQNAKMHLKNIIGNMSNDKDFEQLVLSSFGWSGVMWEIAKELVGDKAVDILVNLIPGFGNKDELIDAIKAAKNGDWIEFTFEVAKIVGQNTPWGKMLKIGEAGSDMYQFCKKVEKIWTKISTYSDAVVSSMWNIVKTYPSALRTNTDLMVGLTKTFKRGLKSIDEVMDAIPNFPQMSSARMQHILHGDASGGLHHISGLASDASKEVVEYFPPNAKGVYKVRYKLPNGSLKLSSMFPDDKSEIQVAKSIEYVFTNSTTKFDNLNNTYFKEGLDATGLNIRIDLFTNGNISSAYPN